MIKTESFALTDIGLTKKFARRLCGASTPFRSAPRFFKLERENFRGS